MADSIPGNKSEPTIVDPTHDLIYRGRGRKALDAIFFPKNVAVIGSTSPWIEAILLNMSNKVTTIEYNVPDCINSSSNDPPEISYCLTILHNTNKT